MKFLTPLLVLPLLLLASCATISYDEPVDGARARVRFAIGPSIQAVAVVRAYSDAECSGEHEWMRLLNGSLFRPDPRRLDMPLWEFHENGAKEFYVAAGQPLFLMFEGASYSGYGYGSVTHTCAVPLAFQPEAGRDYELILHQRSPGLCTVELSTIVAGEHAPRRERMTTFENIGSEGCQRAFNRFRWS